MTPYVKGWLCFLKLNSWLFADVIRCCVQVNQWCESGIYLLASQAVDKCQSQEGAESALTDIEHFLESAEKNQLTELRNLHNQYEVVLSEDIKVQSTNIILWKMFCCKNDEDKGRCIAFYSQGSVLKALKRLEDVQEMFEKRHLSLKRLSAKQTRPIQPVAPRPESSPKRPSVKNTPRTAGGQQRNLIFVFSANLNEDMFFWFLS